jgi:hypothetical protein
LVTAPVNTARFDYNPTTSVALGLLIEESRTNLVLYSEEWNNAAWSKFNTTITANAAVAPGGTVTADAIVENTAAGAYHSTSQNFIKAASATTYTFSVYAKSANRTIGLRLSETSPGTSGAVTAYNLATGAVVTAAGTYGTTFTNASGSITAVGNSWYRVTLTVTSGPETSIQAQVYMQNGANSVYTGDGWSNILLWGAQLEAGGFATSYVATVATTQTREADVATMTGTNLSSWFNANEGTVVASFTTASPYTAGQGVAVNRFPTPFNFTFNSTGVTNVLWYGIGAELYINAVYNNVGTVTQGPNTFVLSVATTGGQSRTALNGAAAVNRTGTQIGSTVNSLAVGGLGGVSALNGTLRRLYYYPFSITATQIQSLSQ